MRLKERPNKDRRQTAKDMLREASAEPTLNEQIDLPPVLVAHMKSFLEKDFYEVNSWINQLETAIALNTLFPDEAERFKQQVLTKKGFPLDEQFLNTLPTDGLSAISQLAAEKLPTFPPELLQFQLKAIEIEGMIDRKLERASQTIQLFPHHKSEITQAVQTELDNLDMNLIWIPDGSILWVMRDALLIDPSLHPLFQEFMHAHQKEFDALFSKIKKVGVASEAKSLATWFAVYKLLLAKEIKLSPSGILLAVEKPKVSSGSRLPERSLSA